MQFNALPAGCIQCWMHQMPVATGRTPAIDLNSIANKEHKTEENEPRKWSVRCICRCKVHRVHQKASGGDLSRLEWYTELSVRDTWAFNALIELHWAALSIQCVHSAEHSMLNAAQYFQASMYSMLNAFLVAVFPMQMLNAKSIVCVVGAWAPSTTSKYTSRIYRA